ncbi:beta-N-acetylhexosaminidase [Alphaproteobacteria bacterium]|nr:beta-N-acetylhexosaminidase [Alphaproteobacteria bacterium]
MLVPNRPFPRAIIFGCSGPQLTEDEFQFFRDADPLGLILFDYNCETPDQLKRLVSSFRKAVDRESAPILIDQEGGRVTRLKDPHWRHPPPASVFAEAAKTDLGEACALARTNSRLIARDLIALGITVDCAPVIDVPVPGAHNIIGDRALGLDPDVIAALGRAICDGLHDEGVSPVIKHMPGHGRARTDSHNDLPRVSESLELLENTDFQPFRLLSDMPYAMTAHIVFDAIDSHHPATISSRIINEIIRGSISFDGVVLSDDIGMEALSGTPAERAQAAIVAGCDVVLECWGNLDVMRDIAPAVPHLSVASTERLMRAEVMRLSRRASAPPLTESAQLNLERLIDRFQAEV